MSAIWRCPLHRGFTQIDILLQIPAPKYIGTAYSYSPVGLLLLKLVKSMEQRQCVITILPYIKKNVSKKSKILLKFSWKSLVSCFVEAMVFLRFQPVE